MAIGLKLKIDVSKIDKSLLYHGKKGVYLDATLFVNDDADQYGQHGAIVQDRKKGDDGAKIYIGNAVQFWSSLPPTCNESTGKPFEDNDSIPF